MNAKSKLSQISNSILKNNKLSKKEKLLEIATQILHQITINPHQDQLNQICDNLTEIGVLATQKEITISFN